MSSPHVPDAYAGPLPERIGYLRSGLTLCLAEVWIVPPGCYMQGRPTGPNVWGVWAVWEGGGSRSLGVVLPYLTPNIKTQGRYLLGLARRAEGRTYRRWAHTRKSALIHTPHDTGVRHAAP